MKLDSKAIIERRPSIKSRLSHFSVVGRQPLPVSEGNERINIQSFDQKLFF
jgi:hypothetical protein